MMRGNGRGRGQRGIALIAVAIFMVVILGFLAIGLDVPRLAHIATETQSVADASARGGAKALMDSGFQSGTGITGAHVISGDNMMNGELAPDNKVKVDEGFVDSIDSRFECCTNNSTCCQNRGTAPYNTVCKSTVGRDCTRPKAVLSMPSTTVTNMFAGIFDYISAGRLASASNGGDNKHTEVQKLAVAMAAGPGDACKTPDGCTAGDWKCYCEHGVAPCLPIAAPSCKYDCSQSQCVLPPLVVSSNSDSAAWTGFGLGSTETNVSGFLQQGPCDDNNKNNNSIIETQHVGTDISITNGISGNGSFSPFSLMKCMIGQPWPGMKKDDPVPPPQGCKIDDATNQITGWGGNVFTIPIFDLDTCTSSMVQSKPMVGFATVKITGVDLVGSPNTIQLQTVRNTTSTNQLPGGECFQTDCSVAMTR